jgi:hypothetical protein
MFRRSAFKTCVGAAVLMACVPLSGWARGPSGGHFGGGGGFSGRAFGGGHAFSGARGFSGGYGRGYIGPRYYGGGGFYGGGFSLGLGVPYLYGYPYAYGYAPYSYVPYAPGYNYYPYGTGACTAGSYDQYGNWVPNPSCYSQPDYSNQSSQPPPVPQNYPPAPQQDYAPYQPGPH